MVLSAARTPAEPLTSTTAPAGYCSSSVLAGSATFHHSHTLHGSDRNRSPRWRRAVVLNYMDADTRVADGSQPLLKGVAPLPEGAVVEGPDFPVVYERG